MMFYVSLYNIYIYIPSGYLNIAMENGPFIDGLPSYKMVDLSMAMLNNQMVYIHIWVNYNNSLT